MKGTFFMPKKNYAVVVQSNTRNLLFINLETLIVEYTIHTGYGIIDVVATKDNKVLLASAYYEGRLLEVDLATAPPSLVKIIRLPSASQGIALTPDDKFALVTGGDLEYANLISVMLKNDLINYTFASAQAVFPPNNENAFIAETSRDRINLYKLLSDGKLVNTSMESLVIKPLNLSGTSDGKFLFACSTGQIPEIAVLDISNPNYYGVASNYQTQSPPQSIVVNKANDRVYVLEKNHIEILGFDSVSKRLTNITTIYHGQDIYMLHGVDQLALSPDEDKLIVSAKKVFIYNVNGILENTLDIDTYGGVTTYSTFTPGEFANTAAITVDKDLVLVDTETLQEVGRVPFDGVEISLLNVAVENDGRYALVSTLYENKVFKLDMLTNSYEVLTPESYSNGLLFSANPEYGIIYGSNYYGDLYNSYITTLDLESNVQVKSPANVQFLAIEPSENSKLLGSQIFLNRVRLYYLNQDGSIHYSNQEISTNGNPSQVIYSPDGNFAFVIDRYNNSIYVLDTSSPYYFGVASITHAQGAVCEGITIDSLGNFVYIVTDQTVETYSFDPVAKRLSLVRYFNIDYSVANNYSGVVNLLLDEYHERILVLGIFKLVSYDLYGVKYGEFPLNNAKSFTLYKDARFSTQ
jgi:WD40 repeat protein